VDIKDAVGCCSLFESEDGEMSKLCLFGAGNTGKQFLRSESWKKLQKEYTDIVFFDNDQTLSNSIEGIQRVWSLDDETDILITSNFFSSIYRECIIREKTVAGIFDLEEDCVCDYQTMCRKKRSGYENEAMIVYNEEERMLHKKHLQDYQKTKDIYHNISEVAIMLSNLCNYAILHSRCPAHHFKTKEIMPGSRVYQIMDELAASGYEGSICFHIYNEPTIDPRLFMFIQYAKKKMPGCKVRIYSNGYYLNQMMIEEFHDVGADVFTTTGYGVEEYERLISLNVKYPFSVVWGNLDERMDWYKDENIGQKMDHPGCYTFLSQVCIYSNGEIGTCCLDYETPYKLGNVFEKSLQEILSDKKIISFQDELINGNRSRFPLCRNCHWNR